MTPPQQDKPRQPWLVVAPLLLAVASLVLVGQQYVGTASASASETDNTRSTSYEQHNHRNLLEEEEDLASLTEKLRPKPFHFEDDEKTKLSPNQFVHLHHMKTGGTSMDRLLHCAMGRLKKDQQLDIPYANIHECSAQHYEGCKNGRDEKCRTRVQESALLSYCAPLNDLPAFGWDTESPQQGAITVLRHPVDRVWSMFRFQTKGCFQCTPLLEIYQRMDNGTIHNENISRNGFQQHCLNQLENHEVANLLSSNFGKTATETDKVNEAISNLRSFFTVVGLTEELNATVTIAGQAFPWMSRHVDWSDTVCDLTHANASPKNNRCGPGSTHWDLPSQPDEETRKAIEEHNALDMKLYEAAVQHFELQKRAAGFDEQNS